MKIDCSEKLKPSESPENQSFRENQTFLKIQKIEHLENSENQNFKKSRKSDLFENTEN